MQLKNTVLEALAGEKARVVLFGSRAGKGYNKFSDVDIGIIPYAEINESKITLLREKIEDLNIPYKVEVVNFLEVSGDFKKEALKEMVVWKN